MSLANLQNLLGLRDNLLNWKLVCKTGCVYIYVEDRVIKENKMYKKHWFRWKRV